MREAKDIPAIAECRACNVALLWRDPDAGKDGVTCACGELFEPTEYGTRTRLRGERSNLSALLPPTPGSPLPRSS